MGAVFVVSQQSRVFGTSGYCPILWAGVVLLHSTARLCNGAAVIRFRQYSAIPSTISQGFRMWASRLQAHGMSGSFPTDSSGQTSLQAKMQD